MHGLGGGGEGGTGGVGGQRLMVKEFHRLWYCEI